MRTDRSGEYAAPEIDVIEISSQAVLCQSGEVPGLGEGWDLVF